MTLDTILDQLKSERDRLHRAIAALEGSEHQTRGRRRRVAPPRFPLRRKMSAEARRRIAEAKRKWWAEQKKKAKGA